MLIRRYDPLRELHAMQERVNRIFEETGSAPRGRRGEDLAVVERWLAPNLAYEPGG